MSEPLLLTRLFVPPPRPRAVLRRRLVERLNQGMSGKLTLISAPAGFGKTTLVSAWAAGSGCPLAWLSLNEGDNDLASFFTYFIAALQTVLPGLGEGALAALQAPQPPPAETLLTLLVNEIAAIPGRFILVLDDYHALDSQPIDRSLTFLLDHLPPGMHLVIATREDPAIPLARLRARGQLNEIRAADLRFTPAEAAEFLNQVMELDLSEADAAALEARTEGWIAGLQLAALSMQGREDIPAFIRAFTGSHHFVLDYLLEEVLQRQPEYVQAFLLRTSILSRLCAPLCEAILPSPSVSGQDTLEYLEHSNLFTVPLDGERRWYRYHHLFGELLRQRLGKPADLAQMHLQASRWYEENGEPAEAFHHALSAGDLQRAAALAEAAWSGMESAFQTAAWLNLVKKLPAGVVHARPGLSLQAAWALSDAGDTEASEAYLRHAEQALASAENREDWRPLPGMIALVRACNAQNLGDLAETVKHAEHALHLIPADDVFHRAQAVITLEFTHWAAGSLEASLHALHAWMDDMQSVGNHLFVIASAFAAADLEVALGRLDEAEKVLRQAIRQAAAEGRDAETVTAHHHLGLAMLAHERGDDAEAARRLESAAALGPRTTLVDWPYRWSLAQAWLKESAGEWAAALNLLDNAGRVYVKNPIPCARPLETLQARIHLKQGQLEKARAWEAARRLSTEDEAHYLGEYDHLTLARVRAAAGRFEGIDDMLERMLALAAAQNRRTGMIDILVTRALVRQAQGSLSQARAALLHALALAEPQGCLRVFVDEGAAMQTLLAGIQMANAGHALPTSAYVQRILNFFSRPPQNAPQPHAPDAGMEIVEPLSPREIEILRLVAQGLSNAEIGQRLFLALSTVKGHNLRIFHKLQVQNRTEAVARARQLGLL